MDSDSAVGKYVCFGRDDGAFCWGRIVRRAKMPRHGGPKDAFVVDGMVTHDGGGSPLRQQGERLVWLDKIDEKSDVIDLTSIVASMSDDDIFMFLMSRNMDEYKGANAVFGNMMKHHVGLPVELEKVATKVLKERVGA